MMHTQLKQLWQRELERQKLLKQSKPAFAYKWQPPGPDLNRVRCNEGPMGFAPDVISQWHKNYRFSSGFLAEMEATIHCLLSARELGPRRV